MRFFAIRRYLIAALAVLAASATGCASRTLFHLPGDAMQLKLQPSDYQTLAAVSGKNCTDVYFVFSFSSPDALDAEQAALKSAPGATLIVNKHVYIQHETVIPVLYSLQCFYVEGMAAKLTK